MQNSHFHPICVACLFDTCCASLFGCIFHSVYTQICDKQLRSSLCWCHWECALCASIRVLGFDSRRGMLVEAWMCVLMKSSPLKFRDAKHKLILIPTLIFFWGHVSKFEFVWNNYIFVSLGVMACFGILFSCSIKCIAIKLLYYTSWYSCGPKGC